MNLSEKYYSLNQLIKNNQYKCNKMINNTGFIIHNIIKDRIIKFTILENNTFFIEDMYIKNEMVEKCYIKYIDNKAIYGEWMNYIK
jgi:hypothetical protein